MIHIVRLDLFSSFWSLESRVQIPVKSISLWDSGRVVFKISLFSIILEESLTRKYLVRSGKGQGKDRRWSGEHQILIWLNTHHETSLGLPVIGSDITNSQTELTWKMSAHTGTGGFLWSLSEQDERCDLDSLFVGCGRVRPGWELSLATPTAH